MALKGYFIQATFEDGTEVSAYAAYDGTWYYFYTDRRFRFTLTSTGAVDIQQYQPIGSNMAWYDIDIITAVSVEQFDPDNSGGGTGPVPEDVYTKDEVNQLIAEAVKEVEKQIPDLVAQAVQEALDGLDGRYVRKTGDTMTGSLRVQNAAGQYSVLAATECTVFGTDNNVFMNPRTGFGVTTASGQYKGRLDQDGYYRCNPAGDSSARVVVNYNGATWYQNNKVVTNIYYSNNHGTINLRDTQSDDTYFLVGSTQLNMYVNNSLRAQIRTSENDGNFITYDDDGNNTWYMPAQISAWTNGGTSQSLITPGADVISFNKAIQVPAGSSFLVSGQCRYGGSFINRYGNSYSVEFNDTAYGTLSALKTLTFSSNYDVAIYRNAGSGNVRGMLVTNSDILLQIAAGSTWVSDIINSSGATDFLQVRQITFKDSGGNSVGTIVGNPGSISMTSNNLQFTDSSNSTTLSYIMENLGGGGGGSGSIERVHQITFVDSDGNVSGTISGNAPNSLIMTGGGCTFMLDSGSIWMTTSGVASGLSGQIFIRDELVQGKLANIYTQYAALPAYITSMLSDSATPSGTTINIYSLGVIDAINDVINMIQDNIGTNFSVSASSGQLANGGQTRGGGAGRGY